MIRSKRLIIMLFFVLTGCGGGSTVTDSTATGLSIDRTNLAFSINEGSDDLAPQVINGSITGVTESIQVVISYSSNGIALASFERTDDTSGRLIVTPKNWLTLSAGTYRDTISVSACFDSACTRHIPGSPRWVDVVTTVTAAVAPATLELSLRGMALASLPGGNHLAQAVTVRDSTGAPTSWTATTGETWLRVNSGGLSGGTLNVVADPVGLPDGFHLGHVTLSSSSALIAHSVILPVGLYKSSVDGATALVSPMEEIHEAEHRRTFATDAVRPYIYSATGTSIAVHHFYTGKRLALLEKADANFTDIVATDDGQVVWALDSAHGEIVALDPEKLTLGTGVSLDSTLRPYPSWFESRMVFVRASGRAALLFSQPTTIIDPATGFSVGRVAGWTSGQNTVLAASRGSTVFAYEAVTGGIPMTHIGLKADGHNKIFGRATTSTFMSGVGVTAFAADPAGESALCIASRDKYFGLLVYDGSSLSLSTLYDNSPFPTEGPASAVYLPDRRSLVYDGVDKLRLYSADHAPLHTWYKLPTSWRDFDPNKLFVSPDGLRVLRGSAFVDIGKCKNYCW